MALLAPCFIDAIFLPSVYYRPGGGSKKKASELLEQGAELEHAEPEALGPKCRLRFCLTPHQLTTSATPRHHKEPVFPYLVMMEAQRTMIPGPGVYTHGFVEF